MGERLKKKVNKKKSILMGKVKNILVFSHKKTLRLYSETVEVLCVLPMSR